MSGDHQLPEEWSLLLHAVAEDELPQSREQRLACLLRESPEFRLEYVRTCQLMVQLGWQSAGRLPAPKPLPSLAIEGGDRPTKRLRGRTRRTAAVLAAIAIAAMACWFGLRKSGRGEVGTIVRVTGTVNLIRGGAQVTRRIGEASPSVSEKIQSGDSIETDRFSSAVIELEDKSRVSMQPGSMCTFRLDGGLSVTVPTGRLDAQVTHQRPGESLSFLTSQARIHVVGTELSVLAGPQHSEVAVLEGLVNVTPTSGEAVAEIAALQFARIGRDGQLQLGAIPPAADVWSEDFEVELASGWTGRRFDEEVQGRLAGVMGARPADHPPGILQMVSSPLKIEGLFLWHPDSVLHLRFRIHPPEWFHIELSARTFGESPKTLNYSYVNPELWRITPGEWRTVDIPLADFILVSPMSDDAGLGRIPTQFSFSGNGPTGVEIDRIWVDRRARP